MSTSWVEECMKKQMQTVPKCERCRKTIGKGHCRECGACGTTKVPMAHETFCSRFVSK